MFSPNNLTEGKSRENNGINVSSLNTKGEETKANVMLTQVGELVYQRTPIDFKAMNKQQKRDTVVEENLLDVKKLLKSSQMAQNAKN